MWLPSCFSRFPVRNYYGGNESLTSTGTNKKSKPEVYQLSNRELPAPCCCTVCRLMVVCYAFISSLKTTGNSTHDGSKRSLAVRSTYEFMPAATSPLSSLRTDKHTKLHYMTNYITLNSCQHELDS